MVDCSKKIAADLPSLRRAWEEALLPWFAQHRRDLPWRRERTPYRVWIAELMLQQTRVDQVIPYYNRFMARFPLLSALAEASQQEVLKAWEGLGYYARARHMHRAAQHLEQECGGRFPDTLEGLRALPGVGPYTAAAVGSLAFNLDAAVVDGNVRRVLARVLACGADARSAEFRKTMEYWADALLIRGRSGECNEAVMELGATCCLPRNPDCGMCPLAAVCLGFVTGSPCDYPVRTPRKPVPHKVLGAGAVLDGRGNVLIVQRPVDAMLGGLWGFPCSEVREGESIPACIIRGLREATTLHTAVEEPLTVVRHAYSHFTIEMHAFRCRLLRGTPHPRTYADCAWVAIDDLARYPFSRADEHIITALKRPSGPRKRW